jgi:hypothetical protein
MSFYCHKLVSVVAIFFMLLSSVSFVKAQETPTKDNDQTIEVIVPASALAKYKHRRTKMGYKFGVNYENLKPDSYVSPVDNTKYAQLFNSETISFMQISGGPQYNLNAASISLEGIYATGSMSSNYSGESVSLSVTKKGLKGSLNIDAIKDEPYVVPYVAAEMFLLDFTEKGRTGNTSGTTGFTTSISAGALLQLNWIDQASARDAYNYSGVENAFLDVYAKQYQASMKSTDPNFKTDWLLGLGLKLEF